MIHRILNFVHLQENNHQTNHCLISFVNDLTDIGTLDYTSQQIWTVFVQIRWLQVFPKAF